MADYTTGWFSDDEEMAPHQRDLGYSAVEEPPPAPFWHNQDRGYASVDELTSGAFDGPPPGLEQRARRMMGAEDQAAHDSRLAAKAPADYSSQPDVESTHVPEVEPFDKFGQGDAATRLLSGETNLAEEAENWFQQSPMVRPMPGSDVRIGSKIEGDRTLTKAAMRAGRSDVQNTVGTALQQEGIEETKRKPVGGRGSLFASMTGQGGKYNMSFLPEELRPNYGHFGMEWEGQLEDALDSGAIKPSQYQKALGIMGKYKKDLPGIERSIFGMKTQLDEEDVVYNAANAEQKLDIDREIGIQQIEAAGKLATNEELGRQEHEQVQNELNAMRETAKVEREKLANIGVKHPAARIVGALASSIGAALGAYAATKAGTKNFAMEVIQAGMDKELGDAQVQLQKGQKTQNAMAQEMQLLSKKLGSTDQARRVMGMGILDRLEVQLNGMKVKAYSEADRTRIGLALGQLDNRRTLYQKEYERFAVGQGQDRLAALLASRRRFAGGMAKKGKEAVKGQSGMLFVKGHNLGDSLKGRNPLTGAPMSVIVPKGTANAFQERKEGVTSGLHKLREARRLRKELTVTFGGTTWDPSGFSMNKATRAKRDVLDMLEKDINMSLYQISRNNNGKVGDKDMEKGENLLFQVDDTIRVGVDEKYNLVERQFEMEKKQLNRDVQERVLFSGAPEVRVNDKGQGVAGYRIHQGLNKQQLQGIMNNFDYFDVEDANREKPGDE